jgi:hypothetical protein
MAGEFRFFRTRPKKAKNGESKYTPHQGEREKLRRRAGGFHNLRKRVAQARKAGITGTEV